MLSPPLDTAKRKLLLSLSSLGAKLNVNTLAHEEASSLWYWAACQRDVHLLQCLMEPRFGFRPDRQHRLNALREAKYNKDVVKVFRDTRSSDSKSGWKWPTDWKKYWPLGDPIAEVEMCETYGVEVARLKDSLGSKSSVKDWKVGFGGEIPGHTPPS